MINSFYRYKKIYLIRSTGMRHMACIRKGLAYGSKNSRYSAQRPAVQGFCDSPHFEAGCDPLDSLYFLASSSGKYSWQITHSLSSSFTPPLKSACSAKCTTTNSRFSLSSSELKLLSSAMESLFASMTFETIAVCHFYKVTERIYRQ